MTSNGASTPLGISREALPAITGLSASTIARLIRAGEFPAPRQTSQRRVVWDRREVQVWFDSLPRSSIPPVGPRATGSLHPCEVTA
jgi:prophage regulatory protein